MLINGQAPFENEQVKRSTVFISDYPYLAPTATVRRLAGLYRSVYPGWSEDYFARMEKLFPISFDARLGKMSKGMQRQAAILLGLSTQPRCILFDEIFDGLDPVVRDKLIDLLLDFVRDENHAILISSHIVSDLEKLCDTIAFLHKGKLLLCEDKDTLREEYALWHGTAGQLEELDKNAIVSRRVTAYGAEALVKRELVPAGSTLTPVSIEELFVLMVKGENVR